MSTFKNTADMVNCRNALKAFSGSVNHVNLTPKIPVFMFKPATFLKTLAHLKNGPFFMGPLQKKEPYL